MSEHDFSRLSHIDETGAAKMVDVGGKDVSARVALAAGLVCLNEAAYAAVAAGTAHKGDVLGVARLAGIMAAKRVDSLIPLTHQLLLDYVAIDFSLDDREKTVAITAEVATRGKTGAEMEALTAVSVTALTIYDMCKAVDKAITIDNIRLLKKAGGKSGLYQRPE
ncbi:MAG TPA: cyclic pyranopterin monophosphate synthase MoaC [Desulfofustis sp.]|nr:cyclic pyranopterin monophosphate synthase MoaC [Desulfofustis sp. PB-SRB1]HBH28858.1 cyclic pyranopterin monophosphate synthase MoaC [Desulfofustis sp.]